MTRLPTMDLYNDAVQSPGKAFSDIELARGEVVKNGLGLPKPASGGFALTYGLKTGSKIYAVRLFHRHSAGLELRYQQISAELARVSSQYFVDFEFQPKGIVVQGQRYPVVKMAWASGEVLGGWVRRHRTNKAPILALRDEFRRLSEHLESRGIAHGDIQGGNVMVDSGAKLRLIDYDGMWVPPMPRGNGEELGHLHFQHPRRERGSFGPKIDRFSFIVLELTLAALAENPGLFDEFNTGENLVLQQTDYADPRRSKALQKLRQIASLKAQIENFERICLAPVDQVPSLQDFLKGSNIPLPASVPAQPAGPVALVYRGPNSVLDSSDFGAASRMVGDRVELIGRVAEVATRTGLSGSYVFVNFGPWRGKNVVKAIVWPKALRTFSQRPDSSWTGRWVSVSGLVGTPYVMPKYGYAHSCTHIGVEVDDDSEIRFITEDEALFRLGRRCRSIAGGSPAAGPGTGNQAVLDQIRRGGGAGTGRASLPPTPTGRVGTSPWPSSVPRQPTSSQSTRSSNQNVVDQMRSAGQAVSTGSGIPSSSVPKVSPPASTGPASTVSGARSSSNGPGCWGCLIPLLVLAALFVSLQMCS
jgi:hypothetical protein